MKPFQSVTVCVEFRMVWADGEAPHDRLLRARVVETVTSRGGVCRAYGEELIAPRKLTDRNMGDVHVICLAQLRHLTKRVVFRYDELLALEPEEFPIKGAA